MSETTKAITAPDGDYYDIGFERPELGIGASNVRLDKFIRERRARQKARLACNADLFCDGSVVALGLCGGHLKAAHKAGSLDYLFR